MSWNPARIFDAFNLSGILRHVVALAYPANHLCRCDGYRALYNSDMEIHHKKEKDANSYRNLNIYKKLEKSGKPFSPRQQYYYARELKDHGFWVNAVYYFEKFLDSKMGWLEDNIATCYNLSLCYNEPLVF